MEKHFFGIYIQVCKKEIQRQPPREPREHRLGKVRQGRSK